MSNSSINMKIKSEEREQKNSNDILETKEFANMSLIEDLDMLLKKKMYD